MSFAHSKIQRPKPRRGLLLARPALEARVLQAMRSHRVVAVCAQAGYGKTALLVRALEQLPADTGSVWVSLDPGDDLHRLLECLVAALEPYDPPWRVAPEGLIAGAVGADVRGLQQAVDGLVNALEATDLAHGVIVIDDLQHLQDEAAQRFLGRLIARLGARWTIVLACRELPLALLARVDAAGELAQFGQEDLRFSAAEVQAWFAGLGVDEAGARALHQRTAGWAVGLRLAAHGAGGSAPGRAIDRAAFDFLASEVLAHLDPDLRRFLLDTSVLHELQAPRCAALTGDARASRWLDEIERRGLFAAAVDDGASTLRLHDLFRDALQHRLRIERPQDVEPLMARAAELEPDPVRKQGLLLGAGRLQEAARALLNAAPQLNTGGAAPTVLRLLDSYPKPMAEACAEWQHVAGLATMTSWRQLDAQAHYGAAEALYRARGELGPAQVMAARRAAVLVALGRLGEADELLARLGDTSQQPAEARLQAATAVLWLHLERCEHDACVPVFEAMLADQLRCTEPAEWGTVPSPRQTACPGMAGPIQRWAAGALAVAGDRPLPLRTFAHLALAWRAFWLGRAAEAQQLLERAQGDATWGGHEVISRNHGLALQAALAVVRGDAAQASAIARARVDEHPPGYAGWGLWHAIYFAARIAAAVGDAAALRGWVLRLQALRDTLPDVTPQRLAPLDALRGAQALLDGDRDAARRHWRMLIANESHADLLAVAAEVRVRLAALCAAERDLAGAAALLAPLLERAAQDGPRGAVLAPSALKALARESWSGHLGASDAATLATWAGEIALPPALAAAPAPDHPLTPREYEVVALIARGQSNKLIARALDLSPHTVKRHIANALGKLDLASRGQAAAWYHGRQAH